MIHLFSIGLLLCMSGLSYVLCTSETNGKVIQVAPGSDVSLSCEDSWDKTSANAVELKLDDGTAHLLVQNFQQQNKGLYRCDHTEGITLEEKYGSTAGETLLYRQVGLSAHLFCKNLGSELCYGRWTCKGSQQMNYFRGGDNDFSMDISSVTWADSGKYQCEILCGETKKGTSYELIVVNVTVQPERVYEGGNMTLCCSVPHLKRPGEVCWIHLDHNIHQTLRRYSGSRDHCTARTQLCFNVSHVHSEQSRWACAVFHEGLLRALLPASVTVSKHTTAHTPVTHTRTRTASSLQTTHKKNTEDDRDTLATEHTEPSPGASVEHVCVMSVCGGVVLLMVTLTICLLCKWKNESAEVCEEEEEQAGEGKQSEDERAEGLLLQRGHSVTYAVVNFKRKPTEDQSKGRDVASSDPLSAAGRSGEEETIIYAGLKMNSEEIQ